MNLITDGSASAPSLSGLTLNASRPMGVAQEKMKREMPPHFKGESMSQTFARLDIDHLTFDPTQINLNNLTIDLNSRIITNKIF
jgi:hypothetical protein